jgi:hypothetical protein
VGWFATKKAPRISREAMLASRPLRNEEVQWDRDENGEVYITMVRARSWKVNLLSKVFYVPERRRLVLDEVGSQVWGMCDGKTSVETMIRRLSGQYKLNIKESEISLLHYLRQLGQKRLVGFLVDRERPGRGPAKEA